MEEEDLEREHREIDQVYCVKCGRPIIIWANTAETTFTCARCKKGLTPEWEY